MRAVLRGGTLATAERVWCGDLLLEDGRIAAIGSFDEVEDAVMYDVTGCFVVPGGIDPHTHMDLQQSPQFRAVDNFYTGTMAAAVGGTTTILDHIGFGPAGCSPRYSVEAYHALAVDSVIDYGFHGVIQHVDDSVLADVDALVREEGIASFKAYSTYGYPAGDLDFLRLFDRLHHSGGVLTIHCENDAVTRRGAEEAVRRGQLRPIDHAHSRPRRAEAECVDTVLHLAALSGDAPVYIVHTSARESVERIALAHAQGQRHVYAETCPQYLLLTEDAYTKRGDEEGTKYLMAPPLREVADQEALWEGLREGIVQTIGTDHCPFLFARDKKKAATDFRLAPGGAPGVEERMRLLFSEGVLGGRLTMEQFVAATSTRAAQIFGLYPRKGTLTVGADADIVVIDPRTTDTLSVRTQHSACDYNTYEGWEVRCTLPYVFSKGQLVAQSGTFCGKRGAGAFLPRRLSHFYES